jgi:hypothetical protein
MHYLQHICEVFGGTLGATKFYSMTINKREDENKACLVKPCDSYKHFTRHYFKWGLLVPQLLLIAGQDLKERSNICKRCLVLPRFLVKHLTRHCFEAWCEVFVETLGITKKLANVC